MFAVAAHVIPHVVAGTDACLWGACIVQSILQVVEEEHLVARTYDAGAVLLSGMEALTAKYPDVLSSPRGAGTLCAIDFSTTPQRNAAHVALRNAGVLVGICEFNSSVECVVVLRHL